MSEHSAGEPVPAPQRKLVSFLDSDFTPEHPPPPDDDNALTGLLRRSRSVEEIDAHLKSPSNLELGQTLAGLLAPAKVSESFKAFIVNEVRQAHAWRAKVSDAVSPDRLGLVRGSGIFDTAQAQGIEAQALRGFAFDLLHRYTVAPEGDTAGLPPLLLRPGVRPSDFDDATDRLQGWSEDYSATYGDDAFEGLEADAYMQAAPKAEVTSEGQAESMGLNEVILALGRLRNERERD